MSDFSATETHRDFQPGNTKIRCDLTGPTSYDTDGSIVDLATAADPTINEAYSMEVTKQSEDYDFVFVPGASDAANLAKIIVIDRTTGAQVAGTTPLDGVSFEAEFRVGM